MGNWPEAKIPGTWEGNGKWPQARNGKMDPLLDFWPFLLFGGHFSVISGLGPLSICFPIFQDCGIGPVSHSADGHSDRNITATFSLFFQGRVLAERIFRGFLFLGCWIFSRIFSPDFFSSFVGKCPEKSSTKIPAKILQNLYNKNPPAHFCRLAGAKFFPSG